MVWEIFYENIETGEIESWGFESDYEIVKALREEGTPESMSKLNGGYRFVKAVEVK